MDAWMMDGWGDSVPGAPTPKQSRCASRPLAKKTGGWHIAGAPEATKGAGRPNRLSERKPAKWRSVFEILTMLEACPL